VRKRQITKRKQKFSKTAKALGIKVLSALLAIADEVIE
jgi:hypothetical protein